MRGACAGQRRGADAEARTMRGARARQRRGASSAAERRHFSASSWHAAVVNRCATAKFAGTRLLRPVCARCVPGVKLSQGVSACGMVTLVHSTTAASSTLVAWDGRRQSNLQKAWRHNHAQGVSHQEER